MARRNHASQAARRRRFRRLKVMTEGRCALCRRRPDAAFTWDKEQQPVCTRCAEKKHK